MKEKPRPRWKDDFAGKQPEWILYDSKTDAMETRFASSQKEAIRKAIAAGIYPRETMDVFPRDSGVWQEIMKPHEFRSFMDGLTD